MWYAMGIRGHERFKNYLYNRTQFVYIIIPYLTVMEFHMGTIPCPILFLINLNDFSGTFNILF